MRFSKPMDRETLACFLTDKQGGLIEVKEAGGALRIKGRLVDLGEIDICGRTLLEGYLAMDLEELWVHLTLHEDLLGIQVTIENRGSESPLIIIRDVPYKKLRISSLEDSQQNPELMF